MDQAMAEFREAIGIKKDDAMFHSNLGMALKDKGRLDEAIAEFREAIRINKDSADAHNCLGAAFATKGRLDEAIAEFREALRLKHDDATVHLNLGRALLLQGHFREAMEKLHRGHQLGSRDPRWPDASELSQLLRQAAQMAQLDQRLPAVLQGKAEPNDAGERIGFAKLCQLHRKRFAAAVRFYGEAFSAQPALADDLRTGNRYDAACAAALASCGQGQDAGGLDDKERGRLRKQALDWLKADLTAWRGLLEKEPAKAAADVVVQMAHWQQDTDFVGVRGDKALAGLPPAERPHWQKLWQEVEALRQGAARSPDKPAASRR